jgi:acetyl esterase/lipase
MKRFLVLAVYVVCLYGFTNFSNHVFAESERKTWKDIDYVGDEIIGHRLDIDLPEKGSGPFPAIVYIYGSAWSSNNLKGTAGMFSPTLLKAGFAVVAINHRGSREAIFPAQIHDAKAAIRFIRANAATYNLDPAWIGVTGGSSGGHLTALLGTSGGVKKYTVGSVTYDLEGTLGPHTGIDSRVQAVCDWFGPTDFRTMDSCGSQMDHDAATSPESILIGGAIQENPDKCALANPATYVDAEDPPFLIFHGNADPLVPFCQSDLLHQRLTEAGVYSIYVQVSKAGHGDGLTIPINLDMMARFFAESLAAWREREIVK